MTDAKRECPASAALRLIGGPWKVVILWHLAAGPRRFSDLRQNLGVTPKVLTQQLRQMEADGLLHREVYPQVPPKVEYSLTPLGESLLPVVDAMCAWGECRSRGDGVPGGVSGAAPLTCA